MDHFKKGLMMESGPTLAEARRNTFCMKLLQTRYIIYILVFGMKIFLNLDLLC